MKDVSFIISSARNPEESLNIVVEALNHHVKKSGITYEILVYSPFKPLMQDNVKWLKERYALGPTFASNTAYHESIGKYAFLLSDKLVPNEGILNAIDLLESDTFSDRKFKVTAINFPGNFDYSITDMPTKGSHSAPSLDLPIELLDDRFLEQKHKYPIFGYPVYERETVKKYLNNFLLNPYFKHHYADNWLPFYIGENGEFPLLSDNGVDRILPIPSTTTSFDHNYDMRLFFMLAINLINGINKNYV